MPCLRGARYGTQGLMHVGQALQLSYIQSSFDFHLKEKQANVRAVFAALLPLRGLETEFLKTHTRL